ncbi:hypothetical protein FIU87_20080 [Bacillus sp. THAF10]|uniref:hypothetical protein n=1 Tax=Bacillus sp. THAF10 TaxID=2587848 RepID=UPI00126853B6|nr:hypothetical protein [Bacillus sp. THAF10]QFT90950.1 hypothetical protein FIU87_20080 [Bacillus sp. THAF10]
MKHAILILVVCSFFISGCSGEQRFGADEDFDGEKFIGVNDNKRGILEPNTEDTEDFYTSQNPNFLDLGADNNNVDYEDDENKFREVIELNSNLEPGPVYITGHTARVTAYAPNGMSQKEKKRVKKDLNKHFIEVTPRYHVHLKIEDR